MAESVVTLACKLATESTDAMVKTAAIRLPLSLAAMIAAGAKDQALDVEEQFRGE